MHGSWIDYDVEIGRDCLIFPNVTIRNGTRIGDRVILHPGVVIGADGFGFLPEGGENRKIPQIGRVVLEDDVEIGANSAVDRAAFGETRIGAGTKIDNLVQVGHNVVIGRNSLLAGQTGIAGSTMLGENVIMGGQSGSVGHLEIGDRVTVGAKAGVAHSCGNDKVLSGYPARDHAEMRRIYVYWGRLPDMTRRIRELEKQIRELREDKENG